MARVGMISSSGGRTYSRTGGHLCARASSPSGACRSVSEEKHRTLSDFPSCEEVDLCSAVPPPYLGHHLVEFPLFIAGIAPRQQIRASVHYPWHVSRSQQQQV
ncbi:hypothetical protein AMECASPLE_011529 [Ameca splendens]|uniref:Uncharacterized protein n=1 Tax=Ameca splendens TaxID=208324 RepID=A0ABV0YZB2_9TELE